MSAQEGGRSGDGDAGLGPLSRLALRARDGDRDALEALARAVGRYLVFVARGCMSPELARRCEVDDLANLAWVTILRELGSVEIRGDGPLRAWLRRVVEARVADARKRWSADARNAGRTESLDELLAAASGAVPALRSDESPLRGFWSRIESERVAAAIARLPPELAEILWLVDFDGCSKPEAARLAGVSDAVARRRHAEARARLAVLLCGPA